MSILSNMPRTIPEEQGVSSKGIIDFLDSIEEISKERKSFELHSIMMARHGKIIAEGWWNPCSKELPHMLFSLSKSFTSTGIGFAVTEGLITVEDKVIDFFEDDLPKDIEENLKEMSIKHLLTMSTGHNEDTMESLVSAKDGDWIKAFLKLPVKHKPGTFFLYNTGASYMLSAIIQKVTGQKLVDYLTKRLFQPLGIIDATWEECPMGINTGGFGLSIKTEDILKFGQLYLNNGVWNGKEIITKPWIEEAIMSHISNGSDENSDWSQGYGYQFWRCRYDSYRADGAFGQLCVVIPRLDTVIAVTSAVDDIGILLNQIWQHILPAINDENLKVKVEEQHILKDKLNSLNLWKLEYKNKSQIVDKISGKMIVLEKSEIKMDKFVVDLGDDLNTVNFIKESENFKINFGFNNWCEGYTALTGANWKYSARGSWLDEKNLAIFIRFVETPFYNRVLVNFNEEKVVLSIESNISFEGPHKIVINGTIENNE